MAIDLSPYWDFGNPALSEQRFRAALVSASTDDALILQTQIARTHGLRRDFAKAREILAGIEPKLAGASAEVRVRHALELGRTYASATHPPELQTPQAQEQARNSFMAAYELAKKEGLDRLAIDALHMLAIADGANAAEWTRKGLDAVANTDDPRTKRWATSLHNNYGWTLHDAGDLEGALRSFEKALAAAVTDTQREFAEEAIAEVTAELRAQ